MEAIAGHDQNRIILNPTRFEYALEVDADAVEELLSKFNRSEQTSRDNNEEKEDMKDMPKDLQSMNDRYEYDVNQAFKELTHRLPKRTRYKSTKIYQKAAQLVDSLNELYLIDDNKKLMARILILLEESIK